MLGSGLLAALFPDQNHHKECARSLADAEPPLILSPFVLAELDYLILKYAGVEAEKVLIEEVARGVYEIPIFSRREYRDMQFLINRYAEHRIGIADASILVLADERQTNDVLTLDVRHFRAVRPITWASMRLLPFDPEPLRKVPAPGRSQTRRATRR